MKIRGKEILEKYREEVEPNWHSVKDKLPKMSVRLYNGNMLKIPLIVYNGEFVTIGIFVNTRNEKDRYFRYIHNHNEIKPSVTHWTELPKPPEGKNE